MPNLKHISKGNSKTECFSFDLPAIETCPGKTMECSRDCYAAKLMRVYKNVDAKYRRNLKLVNSKEFASYMIREIPAHCQFRIHVSGDFRNASYIHKWIKICRARPDVTFYAYTRSWRIPRIWLAIYELNALSNVNVNLSVDDETGAPHKNMKALRWCYLTKTDNVPNWIRPADIVFRSNHLGHKKRRKNAIAKGKTPPPLVKRLMGLVCPLEQGQDVPNFSCAKCRLCVDKPKEKAYA
jgi:hypothetical protein